MKVIQKIQQDNSVKPLAEENQIGLKGGKKDLTYTSKINGGQSSPPRWKDK